MSRGQRVCGTPERGDQERKQENAANRATADPESKGYLPGVPRIMYMPFPFQIFQTPTHVAMTFEYAQGVRIVYTNGTPHPRGPIEWWLGDSRGRWDGDTFVVDITNYNDKGSLATNAASQRVRAIPQSEALHVVERFTRVDENTIDYEATIEDPKVFTAPWRVAMPLHREPDYQIFEYACHEGNLAIPNTLSAGRARDKAGATRRTP